MIRAPLSVNSTDLAQGIAWREVQGLRTNPGEGLGVGRAWDIHFGSVPSEVPMGTSRHHVMPSKTYRNGGTFPRFGFESSAIICFFLRDPSRGSECQAGSFVVVVVVSEAETR